MRLDNDDRQKVNSLLTELSDLISFKSELAEAGDPLLAIYIGEGQYSTAAIRDSFARESLSEALQRQINSVYSELHRLGVIVDLSPRQEAA